MQDKEWQDLTSKHADAGDIDALEALARAHEDAAYRYRSAISLMRRRIQNEQQPQGLAKKPV